MTNSMNRARRGFLALALQSAVLTSASAAYPEKPIRMVVGWSAGGGTDLVARVVAKHLTRHLGQQVIVENRDGASGMIASELVSQSQPDGYLIQYTVADTHSIAPHLFPKIRYDAINDFIPVALVGFNPGVLLVNKQSGINDLGQLIAEAKKRPGKLTFSTWGMGSGGHVRMAAFMKAVGVDMLHVPYKASNAALAAVVSGEVQVMMSPVSLAKPQADAGKVQILAVDTPERYAPIAQVKTFRELGYPNLNLTFWHGILAPKGTPKEVVDKLNAAAMAALAETEVQNDLAAVGVVILKAGSSSVADTKSYLDGENRRWGGIIRDGKITVQ